MANKNTTILLLLFVLKPFCNGFSQLKLAKIFGDNMILQRDEPTKIWGWASPNENISINLNNKSFSGKSNEKGYWIISLPSNKVGGPFSLKISSQSQKLTISNVYFGDVWFCSGQSNMNFRVSRSSSANKEPSVANYPLIRQFDVPKESDLKPRDNFNKGEWVVCSPKTVLNFSAVAYFYAKEIFKKTGIPIGIIHSSWGGSNIKAWMSGEAVKQFPEVVKELSQADNPDFINQKKKQIVDREDSINQNVYKMMGVIDSDKHLIKNALLSDEQGWIPIVYNGYINDQNIAVHNGFTWYKRIIDIPDCLAKSDFTIDLGYMSGTDVTFFNGHLLGTKGGARNDRLYKVPANFVEKGKNELLFCIYTEGGKTGFLPNTTPKLAITKIPYIVALDTGWVFKQGKGVEERGAIFKGISANVNFFENGFPTILYNAMVAPVLDYSIKGVLWYQGENSADAANCYNYQYYLPALIKEWRNDFNKDTLPFILIQLANYGAYDPLPKATPWSIIQEVQFKASQNIKNVGIAITNDIGNPDDVHPTNKEEVGRRLALQGRKLCYGELDLVAQGPVFKSLEIKNNKAIISFDNVGGSLVSTNKYGYIGGFAIAGADNQFYWAKASIVGDKVILESDKVNKPVNVRFAFENSSELLSLYNKEGLPAVPFRTDNLSIVF